MVAMANPADNPEPPTITTTTAQDDKLSAKPLKSSTESLNSDTNGNPLTRKAAIMQVTMAIVANITIISSGMGLGFPSIAMIELTNSTSSVMLTENQASWFGKWLGTEMHKIFIDWGSYRLEDNLLAEVS